MNTVRTIVGAWAAYGEDAIGTIEADLTFIQPSESDPHAATFWAQRTAGASEIAPVRGGHWSIFLRENVGGLSAALAAALEAGLRQDAALATAAA
jgi:hypothetical protein